MDNLGINKPASKVYEDECEEFVCPNGCDPDMPGCPECYPWDTDLLRDIQQEDEA